MKILKNKRLMQLLTLLLVLLLAVACGSDTSTTEEESSEETETTEEESTSEEPAATEEVADEADEEMVTIEYWIPAGRGRDEGVAAVVEAFEAQNPNIHVEVTAIPFGEFLSSMQVAYAGDSPPDAAFLDGVDVQNLAFNGALLAIDDLITDADREDYMTDLVDMVSYDGHAYALPWGQAANAMYYNIDMFDAAGIDVPQTLDEAWTWPEFKENIATVAETNGEGTWGIVGFNSPMEGTFFTWTIVRSFSEPGSPLWQGISDDFTTVDGYINTDEAMEAYAFYQSLYTDGLAPRDNVPDAFGTGQAATYFVIPSVGGVLSANFPDLNWGVMPIPYAKTPLSHTGSFSPAVSAKSDNPDEAKLFVQFFSSPEGYLAYHEVSPTIPGRKSLQAEVPELQEGYLALLFEEAIEWGQARPGGPAYSIFNLVVSNNMMRDIGLGADIAETVDAAVQEMEAQLAQFR